jgi:hypothetical protein
MVLRRLLKPRAEREHHARRVAIVDPLIDRLVAATDARIAQVKDFRTRLREPVAAAREHVGAMIARIPGPIEVGAQAWSRDHGLRPLFAQAADAANVFNRDEGVRAFFVAHPGSDGLAMLALQQVERRVLATVQHGESGLQAEVARTTVSFGEPRVLAPGADEAAVRTELVARSLEFLALRALETIGSMRSQKRELEKERSLLQAELRLAQKRGAGLGRIGATDARDKEVVERDLARIVAELSDAAPTNLLPKLIEELLDALAHPESHLTIEPCTLALDAMNFVVPPSPQAVTPGAAILRLGSRGPFAVLIARFPRAELRAPENRLAEAAKYL